MRVIQAQSAGFCYGVERAVRMAEEAAAAGGCVMLGSIIHNDSVVRRLEALGARQVQSAEEVQPGETVLIRAHGEPVETYRTLEARGARVLDATCPHVLRIHRLVERAEQEGRTPLIIGEDHHPEVIAAASRSSRRVVLGNAEELAEWLAAVPTRRTERLLAVAQTTCIRSIWVDFGITTTPRCKCQRRTTCAALLPYLAPISFSTGFWNISPRPSPKGAHASICTPYLSIHFFASVC